MRRLQHRSRSLAANALAGLLGGALLLGTLEIHGAAEDHSALAQPSIVFTDARHPAQPAHLETSAVQKVPRCAWCVLHLQGLGDALRLPARLERPVVVRSALGESLRRPARLPRHAPVSRGPPLS